MNNLLPLEGTSVQIGEIWGILKEIDGVLLLVEEDGHSNLISGQDLDNLLDTLEGTHDISMFRLSPEQIRAFEHECFDEIYHLNQVHARYQAEPVLVGGDNEEPF